MRPARAANVAAPAARDLGPDAADFRDAVLRGLAQRQKALPAKFLYDEEGSRLFQKITRLEAYYPTRTETKLLRDHRQEMADLIGPGAILVEFGAGSLEKIRILLGAMDNPAAFVPIDISRSHLIKSAAELAREFPDLAIRPVVADFAKALSIEAVEGGENAKRIGFFPGSTIGNFAHPEATGLLASIAGLVRPGGELLIGVDLKKDREILLGAYNDHEGITAAFNRNILVRINRELGADFDPGAFSHHAPYNADDGRIEMHLVSREAQVVRVADQEFAFAEGESIHTENSYKYGKEEFLALAEAGGFAAVRTWTDPDQLFSVHYLRAAAA